MVAKAMSMTSEQVRKRCFSICRSRIPALTRFIAALRQSFVLIQINTCVRSVPLQESAASGCQVAEMQRARNKPLSASLKGVPEAD